MNPTNNFLTFDERAAIYEIESYSAILQLLVKESGFDCAAIQAVCDDQWVGYYFEDNVLHMNDADNEAIELALLNRIGCNTTERLTYESMFSGAQKQTHILNENLQIQSGYVPIILPDGRFFGRLYAAHRISTKSSKQANYQAMGLYAKLLSCILKDH